MCALSHLLLLSPFWSTAIQIWEQDVCLHHGGTSPRFAGTCRGAHATITVALGSASFEPHRFPDWPTCQAQARGHNSLHLVKGERVPHKSFSQECPRRVSCKNVPQQHPRRFPVCPTRGSHSLGERVASGMRCIVMLWGVRCLCFSMCTFWRLGDVWVDGAGYAAVVIPDHCWCFTV